MTRALILCLLLCACTPPCPVGSIRIQYYEIETCFNPEPPKVPRP